MEENKSSPRVKLPGKEYYTIDDLAEYFGVSQDLIVHFVKNGMIKTVNKDSHGVLIPKKDFNQGTKDMLEYLLSSPIDGKTIKAKIGGRINAVHTFWIFGLGMGLGSWLISGKLSDFIVGIIIGFLVWFVLLILFRNLAMTIYKWTKEKLKKPNLL